MTDAPARPAPRRRSVPKWALWLGGGVAAVVALVALVLVLADTGAGHRAITRYLAGLEPANGLQVRVGRIEGSIYGRMVLHDLELRDPQGVFLTSPAVTVDWRPFALAGNHLVVREASSDLVRVLRRPALVAVPRPPNAPLLPSFDITVDRLDFRRIEFAAPVAGRAHTASLGGRIDIADGRAQVDLRAQARPHDGVGGGDSLIVRIDATPAANRLVADVRLNAPADGLVNGMAGLGGRPLSVQLSGSGDWAQWSGRGVASLGAERLLDLGVTGRSGLFQLQGVVRPALFTPDAADRLLAPEVAVRGSVDVEGRRLDTNLRLTSQALDLTGVGLIDLGSSRFGDFRIEARLLRPQALLDDVRGRDVRLSLNLDGAMANPTVEYRLAAAAIGFGDVLVEGLVAQGRFTVGSERTVAPVRATATRVVGVDEAVGGVLRNMRLEGDVVITPEQIASDNLRLRSEGLDATLVFAASLSTGRWDAALKGTVNRYNAPGLGVVNLTTDTRLVPVPGGGFRVVGSVRVETVRIDNAALRDLLGGPAVATAAFERTADGTFVVSNLRLQSPALTVTDGRGRYAPNGAISLTASARSERYGPIQLSVEGRADAPVVRVRAPQPNIGVPLTDVEVLLRATDGGYRIEASGASPYGPLDVEAMLRLDGGPLTIDVTRARFAGLNVSGQVQQTPAGPFAGVLNVGGSGFTGTIRLSAAGGVQQAAVNLRARNGRIPTTEPILIAEGTLEANATLFPDAPVVTANLAATGVRQGQFELTRTTARIDYRNNAGRAQLTAAGRGGAPFDLAADGSFTAAAARVDVRGTLNRIPLRLAAPAEVRKMDDSWRLMPVTVVLPQGRAVVAATTGAPTRVAVRLEQVDLSILRAFAPDLGVAGVASGDLNLALGANPTGSARLTVEGFTRTGLVTAPEPVNVSLVSELTASAGTANAVIRRRGVVIGRLQARLAPIGGGGSWMDRLMAAPLSGGVRYNGPAEVLWALTGMEGQSVSGPVAVGADFTGRLGQPRTTGVVRGRGLRYENQAYGTVVRDLAIEGRLNGSRLELQQVTGRAGSGTVTGSGYINLAADEGFPMDLRLQLRRAQLAASDDLAAELTGEIAITNSRAEPALISGSLVVDEARYRIVRQGAAEVVELTGVRRRGDPPPSAEIAAPAGGLPGQWRLDIAVSGDNRIFVTGMGLEAEWQASLRVTGTLDRPSLAGEIRAVRGAYSFAGRRLDLTRGVIRFAGESPPNPLLDVLASTTVEGVTVTVSIAGRAQSPQISFTSSPALPQDEVLSRLLFGGSVAELSAPQALQLAASLNALRGGGGGLNPLGALRQATGVDRLRFFGGDDDRGAGFAAGKYITNDVYVEVTTDARGFTAIQLEIALSRSLSLLAQIGSFGGNGLNLRYSRDY